MFILIDLLIIVLSFFLIRGLFKLLKKAIGKRVWVVIFLAIAATMLILIFFGFIWSGDDLISGEPGFGWSLVKLIGLVIGFLLLAVLAWGYGSKIEITESRYAKAIVGLFILIFLFSLFDQLWLDISSGFSDEMDLFGQLNYIGKYFFAHALDIFKKVVEENYMQYTVYVILSVVFASVSWRKTRSSAEKIDDGA